MNAFNWYPFQTKLNLPLYYLKHLTHNGKWW
jgi:hypothetical protein